MNIYLIFFRMLILIPMFFLTLVSCSKSNDINDIADIPDIQEYRLWYEQPARKWDEALPVGNGRLGAMVFGGIHKERIQINEESLWAGRRLNTNNPDALKNLNTIRNLIFDKKITEAYLLGNKSLLGIPPRFRSHQTFGDIRLELDSIGTCTDYKRMLALNNGVSTTRFKVGDVSCIREVFASAPDDVIAINIKTDKPGSISGSVTIDREKDAVTIAAANQIQLLGQIIDDSTKVHGPGGEHMKFAGKLILRNSGGEVLSNDSSLIIRNADEVTLLITMATDYNINKLNFDRSIDPSEICSKILERVEDKSYEEIKNDHIRDHKRLFNRVELILGDKSKNDVPTDIRLADVINGEDDPDLVSLYFQYGRYLLMGSSRAPGKLPANLQGIWNEHFNAPWNADYHTNINLQMNYWHAEICNLPETVIPLTDLIDRWREPGRITAKEMYDCSGWTIHHATDIFGKTTPNADMRWGMSPLSGVWMTFPLWRHFEFTLDTDYLEKRAYPIMKEAMHFVQDFLIEKDGFLVTNPTMSPENAYIIEGRNEAAQLTYAATIDNQIITAHINNCIKAGEILDVDKDLRKEWEVILAKIPPVSIGRDSTIMEWIEDYKEWEPGHRHMSHLLGLYPLSQITPYTPELFIAAKRTIAKRLKYGGGHTGWSRAWMINFFARLLDKDAAYQNVMALLRKSTQSNLFDSHPPFQIDGNFGGTAGIAEMLLQSHNNEIHILPVLPDQWPSGKVKGLKARGGYTVEIEWNKGELTQAVIYSKTEKETNVRYKNSLVKIKGAIVKLDKDLNGKHVERINTAVIPVPSNESRSVLAGWGSGSSWIDQVLKINQIKNSKNIDIVFLGNSITQSWGSGERGIWGPGKEAWDKYFANRASINMGISGDRTQHVLWRIENGSLDEINPKIIVLHIGTNNIPHNTAPEITEGVISIISEIEKKLPQTKILLLGIFPRGDKTDHPYRNKILSVNKYLASFGDEKKIFYKDIGNIFLHDDGSVNSEMMAPDFVHLKKKGYFAWAEAIEPDISKLLVNNH